MTTGSIWHIDFGDEMQIARLFEIVYLLLDKKSITASELAERFEVSARTIYRDIDALSASGIPVYTIKGKGGGIRLSDGFVLDKSLLSEKEQGEILTALQALGAARYHGAPEVLDKLGTLFRKSASNWIEVDFSEWGLCGGDAFEGLKHAILEKRVATFEYYSSYGEKTTRVVEPQCLWFKHRSWYLRAYDRDRQDDRLFKLSRLKRLSILDEAFNPRPNSGKPSDTSNKRQVKFINLKLKVSAAQIYRIYDEFDESMIESTRDGDFICEAIFPEDEWVYGFIMSFGPYAEVLEPAHIREVIKDRVEKILHMYSE